MIATNGQSFSPDQHLFSTRDLQLDAANIEQARLDAWRERLRSVFYGTRQKASSLPQVLGFGRDTQFFQLEYRRFSHTRLGPGLSRESNAFWALSEW